MGRVFIVLTITLFVASCSSTNEQSDNIYEVTGTIENFEADEIVVLSTYDPITQNRTPIDTSKISSEGKYNVSFEFDEPGLWRIDFPGRQNMLMAIDRGQRQIVVDAEGRRGGKIDVYGSKDTEKLLAYDAFRAESNTRLVQPTYTARKEAKEAGDPVAEAEAVARYVKANKVHRNELIDFTEDSIGPSVALYGTMLRWTGDDAVDRLDRLVSAYEGKYPNTTSASAMREKVERFRRVAIGAKAPKLEGPTPDGGVLSLNDIDADYVLIDFWASWCGPCISQVPDLIAVHDEFKDRGFDILSVSVDSREEKWKAAIDKYSLAWPHISDVKGWESPLARDYNVTFVPYNFLVDRQGTILAKNLHTTELYEAVDKLVTNKEDAD